MLTNNYPPNNSLPTLFSAKELVAISKNINNAFAPVKPIAIVKNEKDSPLSRQQLLEVNQNISLYYPPRILSNTHKLALLSIDPVHFYVYWNLANHHQYRDDHDYQDNDLKLRVFSQCKNKHSNKKAKLVFETTVCAMQSKRKITLHETKQGAVYSASIGRDLPENGFVAFVNSNQLYHFYQADKSNDGIDNTHDFLSLEEDFAKDSICVTSGNTSFKHKNLVIKTHYAGANCSGQGKKKQ